MPFFQYTATDKEGKTVQGAVQAPTPQDAAMALSRGGLMVTSVVDARTANQVQTAPPPVAERQASTPPISRTPGQIKAVETPYAPPSPTIHSLGPKLRGPVKKTKWGSDKDLYFIFNQLASYARSGSGVAVGASNLSNTYRREDYRESLALIAKNSMEGNRMADTLELYPYLYPPHVVGMVRAGEIGGYVPEALEAVAGQSMHSIKYRRWFIWLGLTTLMVVGCIPLMQAVTGGALHAWDTQEKAGGNASPWGAFGSGIVEELKWPVGPIILVGILLIYFGGHLWQSTPVRRMRHKLALIVPSIGKRTRAESFAAFSWNMAMLSKVGLPPRQVWNLASATMPNQEMRHQMELEGARMTDTTKLSEALARTKTIPTEYAPMVQTGEITGDIPGQLLQASLATQHEFETHDKFAKSRVGCWILLLMGLGSAILMGMYYGGFMSSLMKKILGD